jgi:murein DD-endopeptidase MepM/ murein hydrolase activator NlpD
MASVLLVLLVTGTAAAFSVEDVKAMTTELAESEYYSPELCMRYLEYKQQRVEVISYTVVKGDTLIGISGEFGVSLATICESNDIENPNYIKIGQQLQFPEVSGLLYTVLQGDELVALSEKYQVDYEVIWLANSLDSEALTPGTKLVIPGAELPNPMLRGTSVSRGIAKVNSGFIWPLQGRLSSTYGMRKGSFHWGIDITGRRGTPIRAVAAGQVISAGWSGTYGYRVQVQHKSGISTLYAHASKLNVAKGDQVSQGDIIAYVGSTGKSSGPHLHFEVRVNGRHVNPLSRLP